MYTFRDTVAAAAPEDTLPAEAVCFNGYWLDNEVTGFRTLSVSGREVMEQEIDSYTIGYMDGAYVRDIRYPSRTITVQYQIMSVSDAAFRQAFNKLNALLAEKEAKLWFFDEQDKYFIASPAGNSAPEPGRRNVIGEIEFFCADPRKYAFTQKTFTAAVSDGVLTATVENEGSVAVPVDYEITMNSENGYIGIVSANGVMQYGRAEETDGETIQRDETLLTTQSIADASTDTGGTCVMLPGAATQGTMSYSQYGNTGYWISLNSAGSGNDWHGALKTITIPADSQSVAGAVNFTASMKHWFELNSTVQIGAQTLAFLDANNNCVCGMKIYKTLAATNMAIAEHWVNGKCVNKFSFCAEVFGGSNAAASFISRLSPALVKFLYGLQLQNPFSSDNGHNDFMKTGGTIRMYFNGKYYTYNDNSLKNTAVKKVQLGLFRFGNYSGFTKNFLGDFSFKKMKVETYEDRPNRYANGDVLKISGEEGKVYVNGMIRMGDEVTGTQYFQASPGDNVIKFYHSDWADPVTAKAIIREAWL